MKDWRLLQGKVARSVRVILFYRKCVTIPCSLGWFRRVWIYG